MALTRHHADVIHITPVGDVAVLYGFLHRTAWLMRMGAIGETASTHQIAHLGEALCKGLSKSLEQHNEANAALYRKNTDAYLKKLDALDKRYSEALYDRKYDTLLFADRFPFRYLTDDYDIRYYAAFAGCSAESEASFETVAFLSQKLNELKLPAVITIDGSDQKIAKTVLSTAGSDAEILTLDSMQSVKTDGDSYLSVMESNLEVLKKALL